MIRWGLIQSWPTTSSIDQVIAMAAEQVASEGQHKAHGDSDRAAGISAGAEVEEPSIAKDQGSAGGGGDHSHHDEPQYAVEKAVKHKGTPKRRPGTRDGRHNPLYRSVDGLRNSGTRHPILIFGE
jgi:hypothetical protein